MNYHQCLIISSHKCYIKKTIDGNLALTMCGICILTFMWFCRWNISAKCPTLIHWCYHHFFVFQLCKNMKRSKAIIFLEAYMIIFCKFIDHQHPIRLRCGSMSIFIALTKFNYSFSEMLPISMKLYQMDGCY